MRILLDLDYLGTEPKLYFQGEERHKSKFGGVMTIISAICIIFLAGYFLIAFFQMKTINVLSFSDTNFDPSYDISSFPLFFRLIDTNNNLIDPRLATAVPYLWNQTKGITFPEPLITEPCVKEKHIPKDKQYLYEGMNFTGFQCLKNNNMTLFYDVK
jgi:hypothetical protein